MKLFSTSLCITLAIMTVVSEAAPSDKRLHIALKPNEKYKPNIKHSLNKALKKYSKNKSSKHSNKTSTQNKGGKVSITDYQSDSQYFGTVTVGTPGVELKLDFDTGSSDLWFASTLCTSCGSSQTRYNPSKSRTYKKDGRSWSIEYGDGSSSSGTVAYDTVNLGGFSIKNQMIQLAKTESSSFIKGPVDGLLGLGFNTMTSVKGAKTPMDNLISQGHISKPIFGVYLGKASNGGGGEYVFGGYNASKIRGKLTTVPVDNSRGYWGVKVQGAKVGSDLVTGSFGAIIDTGTTLLLFPTKIASKIANGYNAKRLGDGTFSIDCDTTKLKPLVFNMGGAHFEVPVDSLIFQKIGSTCMAGFGEGSLDMAILGDVFLKNNYVVFNQKVPEVRIAPSKT